MMFLEFTNDYSVIIFSVVAGSVTAGVLLLVKNLLAEPEVVDKAVQAVPEVVKKGVQTAGDNVGVQNGENNVQHVEVQTGENNVQHVEVQTGEIDFQTVEVQTNETNLETVEVQTVETNFDTVEVQTDEIQTVQPNLETVEVQTDVQPINFDTAPLENTVGVQTESTQTYLPSVDTMWEFPLINDPILEPTILTPPIRHIDVTLSPLESPLENVTAHVTHVDSSVSPLGSTLESVAPYVEQVDTGVQTSLLTTLRWLKNWIRDFFDLSSDEIEELIGAEERVVNWVETLEPGSPGGDVVQSITQSPVATLSDIELFEGVDALYSPTPTVTEEVIEIAALPHSSVVDLMAASGWDSLIYVDPSLAGLMFG